MNPIPFPKHFRATIVRSDEDDSVKVWVMGAMRRVDTIRRNTHSTTISRPELGVLYRVNHGMKCYWGNNRLIPQQ